ncbi:MAG TPA: hypothetical protein PLC80_13130 [Draconibacterium sp.]|nr:hypothetical protein [Draconibacterium sp.]
MGLIFIFETIKLSAKYMSFKIFTLQLSGKLKPVETIEKQRKTLLDDFNEFEKVKNSEELKKYLELESEVNSDTFKKKKAEVESLHFNGSKEFNQLKEFESLQKKQSIKKYFKVANSPDLIRFNKLKPTEKLAEFYKLQEFVKEGQFAKEKKEIESQIFKGSVEEKHWIDYTKLDKSNEIKVYKELHNSDFLKKHELFAKSEKLKNYVQLVNIPDKDKAKQEEFKRLKNDSELINYFKFEKSKKLKIYRETAGGLQLTRYNELKAFVENPDFKKREAFLKDKKKFENSEANKKYTRFKQLLNDQDLKFFFKFEKSGLYKNYLDVAQSFDLKRFYELEELTSSKEFKEKKAYLEDKKKWEKTGEFARQQEYLKMKQLPHLAKYLKNKGANIFNFFNEWQIVFEDNFQQAKLDTEKWSTKSYLAEKMLGDNYSLAGDNHIFTDGKNLLINGKLNITVKKEKVKGKVWQMPAGFVTAELDYSSGIISSWKSFWTGDGIIEAKIKFDPVQQIVSSFYLAGEQNTPRLNLLEMGAKNRVGILNLSNGGKATVNGLDISNLKRGKWYIFSVVKSGANFTWKINEAEIFTLQSSELKEKLHLNASSIVIEDVPAQNLPAGFEIEWVRCYRKGN